MAPVDLPQNMPQYTGTSFHEAGEGVTELAQRDNMPGGQPQNQASSTIPNGNSNREAGHSQSGPLHHGPSKHDAPYATAHPDRSQMSIPNSSGQQNFPGQAFGPPLPSAAASGASICMAASQNPPGPRPCKASEHLSTPPTNTGSTSSNRPDVPSSARAEHLEERPRPENDKRDDKPKPWDGIEGLAALDDLAAFGDLD